MFDKLQSIKERYEKVVSDLSVPNIAQSEMLKLNKERAQLEPIVEEFDKYTAKVNEKLENETLLDDEDAEMRAMAQDELTRLNSEIESLNQHIKILLLCFRLEQ